MNVIASEAKQSQQGIVGRMDARAGVSVSLGAERSNLSGGWLRSARNDTHDGADFGTPSRTLTFSKSSSVSTPIAV